MEAEGEDDGLFGEARDGDDQTNILSPKIYL